MKNFVLGTKLSPAEQRKALARFVHRFTGDHIPRWASGIWKDGKTYPVQFSSDADWLAHTRFVVTADEKLDGPTNFCESTPTWPLNPELRIGMSQFLGA